MLLALAGIGLAAVAQYVRTFFKADRTALVLLGLALVVWVVALVTDRVALPTRIDETRRPAPGTPRRASLAFGAAALVLALVTFLTSNDNAFTLDNVPTWILSVAVLFYAFWEPADSSRGWQEGFNRLRASAKSTLVVPYRAILLLLIVGVGVVFYFHNLDGIPAEMDSDHAEKILDVNDIVNNGLAPIFFERNTGREPLEFYLIAALVDLGHPLDHMALKLVTATMGVLVIPGTFLLARELFDDSVAFLAAGLVAISKWPMTIARMGLRFPFTPVFVAPLLFFLVRAFKYERRNDYLLAGLFLGAGLYGYNAFRVAPLLVVSFMALWPLIGRRMDRKALTRYALNCVLVFVVAAVVFAPLLRYSVDHPESFWYRAITRLSGEGENIAHDPLQTLGSNAVNAALMFNWSGDEAWPNSIPGDPALDYLSGGLFLLGLLYALYRMARYRERSYAFVLMGLVFLLLPTALALAFPNENPSNVRAGGAVPLVFILVALAPAWIARNLWHEGRRRAAVGFVTVLLVAIATINSGRYLHDFDESYRRLSWNSSEVATVIRSFAESVGDYDHAYIMLYPHWIDTRNVAINMGKIDWDQTLPDIAAASVHVSDAGNKLFVLNPNDTGTLARLQDLMPTGQLRLFKSRTPGKDFVLWYVPGTIAPDLPLSSSDPGIQK